VNAKRGQAHSYGKLKNKHIQREVTGQTEEVQVVQNGKDLVGEWPRQPFLARSVKNWVRNPVWMFFLCTLFYQVKSGLTFFTKPVWFAFGL
jgi:hypothetical protein